MIAAAAAWSLSGIFITIIVQASHASATGIAFWRDLLACATLLGFTPLTHPGKLKVHKKDLPWITGMGAGLGSFHIFYNQSILLNGIAVTTVQQAAMLVVVTIAALYLWKEVLTREKIMSMGIIFVGTVMASGLDFFELENNRVTGVTVGFIVPTLYAASPAAFFSPALSLEYHHCVGLFRPHRGVHIWGLFPLYDRVKIHSGRSSFDPGHVGNSVCGDLCLSSSGRNPQPGSDLWHCLDRNRGRVAHV